MNLIQISLCNKALDFKPRRAWPRPWPAYAWQGFLLAGFDKAADEPVLQLDGDFLDILQSCYAELSLGETARLWKCLQQQPNLQIFTLEQIFTLYGRPFRDRSEETLLKLAETPWKFQNWCDDKGLHIQDLAPLRALKIDEALAQLLTELATAYPTKSSGTECLELIVELLMSGTASNELSAQDENLEEWLKRLREKRYPQSSTVTKSKNSELRELRWPKHSQVRWTRQGDRSGLEIKLFAGSEVELEKIVDQVKDSARRHKDIWS